MRNANAIDAHVHIWDAQRRDDILICDAHPELNDRATSDALSAHLTGSRFSRAILVQSAPDNAHSDWLIEHTARLSTIAGVVAWIDPTANDALDRAECLIAQPRVCGVRLMLNRMTTPAQLLAVRPMAVLSLLAKNDVTIELLALSAQLDFAYDLAGAISGKIVVDHCGLPPQNAMADQIWRDRLQKLATRPNVATKLSGLIEPYAMMPPDHTLFAVMDFVLAQFGTDRLMAASNFPVVQLTAPEQTWEASLASWVQAHGFSPPEQASLWHNCAATWYPRTKQNVKLESPEND
ncbi:amidohydrolase family protein [Planktomarina temperata]|jgi:L-fuconolactonase|uniref:Amidohydrolase n=1 Tax=Planktomarina temperata RCA23 TaxID=666509 RepID=A0AAN0RHB0_9RHOB|nr:amidohydrolase [Planktomarina temperata RCA23]HBS37051.1 amidohydrolase [Paracoccaceae bacterium]